MFPNPLRLAELSTREKKLQCFLRTSFKLTKSAFVALRLIVIHRFVATDLILEKIIQKCFPIPRSDRLIFELLNVSSQEWFKCFCKNNAISYVDCSLLFHIFLIHKHFSLLYIFMLNIPGPPSFCSRYMSKFEPFSYGTVEKASSGSTPFKSGTKCVKGWFLPKTSSTWI